VTNAVPNNPLPPRLADPLRWSDRPALRSAGWLLAIVCALVFSRLLVETKATFTQCLLKRHTGIPCAFCGSTRALAALSHGDIAKACAYNPVISGAALFGLGVCGLGTVRPRVYRAVVCFTKRMLRRKQGRIAFLVFAALNWVYLLFAL
jgi:hypothetical protein